MRDTFFWRRTRDSLSLRFPNQPSQAVVCSASSTASPFYPSLYRPPDALGQNAHAASNAALGSNPYPLHKKKVPRRCVIPFSGGGQEIRNNPNSLSFYFSLVQKPHNQAIFEVLAFQIISVCFIFAHKIMSKL